MAVVETQYFGSLKIPPANYAPIGTRGYRGEVNIDTLVETAGGISTGDTILFHFSIPENQVWRPWYYYFKAIDLISDMTFYEYLHKKIYRAPAIVPGGRWDVVGNHQLNILSQTGIGATAVDGAFNDVPGTEWFLRDLWLPGEEYSLALTTSAVLGWPVGSHFEIQFLLDFIEIPHAGAFDAPTDLQEAFDDLDVVATAKTLGMGRPGY